MCYYQYYLKTKKILPNSTYNLTLQSKYLTPSKTKWHSIDAMHKE